MENETENNTPDTSSSLMDTKVNDLTVGDTIKMNAVVVAVMVAIPLVIGVGVSAKEKFTNWRKSRKDEVKEGEVIETTATEEPPKELN